MTVGTEQPPQGIYFVQVTLLRKAAEETFRRNRLTPPFTPHIPAAPLQKRVKIKAFHAQHVFEGLFGVA